MGRESVRYAVFLISCGFCPDELARRYFVAKFGLNFKSSDIYAVLVSAERHLHDRIHLVEVRPWKNPVSSSSRRRYRRLGVIR